MRVRRVAGAILSCLGLGGFGPARADDAGERPLLKIEGTPEAGGGGSAAAPRRGSKRLGQPPEAAPGEQKSEGEEPTLPHSQPSGRMQLKMRYQGVAPGRTELPPRPQKLPIVKGPQRLTWPGFQIQEGRPTLFLQLTGTVEYSVSERPGQVLITLHDTVAPLRNNLRPLLLQEFGTAVREVRFSQRKNTVTIAVAVKGPVAHTERLEQAENGYSMLLVRFSPMGQSAEAKATPVPAAQPEPEEVEAPAEPPPDDRAWARPRTLSSHGAVTARDSQQSGGTPGGGGAAAGTPAAAPAGGPAAGKGW